MKTKIFGFIFGIVIFSVLISSVFILTSNAENDNSFSKLEEKVNKFGIKVKEHKGSIKIDENKILDIAEEYTNEYYKNAKCSKALVLLSDEGISTNAISTKAKDLNPEIKNCEYLNDIPVWIITYEGLSIKRHGQTLTEDNLVFDANTGEFLYGFR